MDGRHWVAAVVVTQCSRPAGNAAPRSRPERTALDITNRHRYRRHRRYWHTGAQPPAMILRCVTMSQSGPCRAAVHYATRQRTVVRDRGKKDRMLSMESCLCKNASFSLDAKDPCQILQARSTRAAAIGIIPRRLSAADCLSAGGHPGEGEGRTSSMRRCV